ncbi:MAG: hypothetical protein EON90_01800 [Brevundimonas sp.]|nr:MAG: hypothetical protein EON90_01800 [Brevundimonas sp.]
MRTASVLAALALGLASPVMAQSASAQGAADPLPPPVPIEEWPLEKVSRIGLEMYKLDTAAWRATDALVASISQDEARTIRGWLIAPVEDGLRVRFYREGQPDPVPGWDVIMKGRVAGPVTPTAEASLAPDELAQARALATARANIGRLRCSARLNTVIMDDPDSDGWLVWLLTPTPDSGAIPLGGHYRFRISADGGSVLQRDQLSNSCFFADRPPAGARDPMLLYTQIVSRTPVETQVFLSIQNQLTLVITAGNRYFSVGGARIADITDMVNRR